MKQAVLPILFLTLMLCMFINVWAQPLITTFAETGRNLNRSNNQKLPNSDLNREEILWSQMNPTGFSFASQEFEETNAQYTCQGADDFVIVEGPWTINVVKFYGGYWNGTGPVMGFNIYFYENAASQPGNLIDQYLNLPYSSDGDEFTVNLPSGMVLSDGHYWISIQGRMDFAIGGQYGWQTHDLPQIELERHWINPGGGFGSGTVWIPGSDIWGSYTERDNCFQLEGEVGTNTITDYPYIQDFENGMEGWTSGAISGTNHWQLGTPAQTVINQAHSGANAWMTGLSENYSNVANTWLMSPVFDFSGLFQPQLSVWINIWCENYYDGMILESTIDGGASWQHVIGDPGFYNNDSTAGFIPAPNWSGTTAGVNGIWTEFATGLPLLANQEAVQLRFRFASDGSVTYEGMAVDDFVISDSSPGVIEGTVTLQGGTGNVTEATISAGNVSVHPEANGTYQITLAEGIYNVKASLLGYQEQIISNVEVNMGETVSNIDFTLGNVEISLDPMSISINMLGDDPPFTIPLTITNGGAGELSYSITADYRGISRMDQPNESKRDISRLGNNDPGFNLIAPQASVSPIEKDFGSRELFDLIYHFPSYNNEGEFGVVTDGNYIYTSRWNASVFYKYALDGTYIGPFSVPGLTNGVLGMTFDGEFIYAVAFPGNFSNIIYKLDLANQTFVGQFSTDSPSIGITYDAINDGFWVTSVWGSPLRLVNRTGALLQSLDTTATSISDLAWDGVSEGAPYLWGYTQTGTVYNTLVKIDVTSGAILQSFDLATLGIIAPNMQSGGFNITNLLIPGLWTFMGMVQNDLIWVLELKSDFPSWMTVDPIDGTVPAGQSTVINITFSSEGLVNGTYPADLHINSNAQADPVVVPVVLNVVDFSPDPGPAHNPIPVNSATNVPLNTPIGWTYTTSTIYTDPVGYWVNMWTGDTSGEPYQAYVEGGPGDYEFQQHPFVFAENTTYFWQVIPTTNSGSGRSATERTTRGVQRESELRGDAENCPIWSFTTVGESSVEIIESPFVTELKGNYPNPFNPDTTIRFSLQNPGFVRLDVLNIRGQKVITLVDEFKEVGRYEVNWSGRDHNERDVASGIYIYRMQSGDYTGIRKMLLIK